MPISNVTRAVDLTGKILSHPAISGMQNGYWYHYVPNANNTLVGAQFKPYRWGTALPLLSTITNLTMSGSIPYVRETWEGTTTTYHGGCIEWVGQGVNDITNTPETDAFFFAHLGALSANDTPFYWDRCFLAEGSSEWDYYKYHEHFPNFYEDFDNGRITLSGGGYIVPADKSFGYVIDGAVTSMGTPYTSVIARIHTPSIGGAHNSHNDVNLPTVQNKNYLISGILKGNSDRYHAFYIAANGSQWDVFVRTYVDTAASFTLEVNLGTYDLADPVFNPVTTTGTQSLYPIRASCGKVLGSRIYIPVIYNNATSGFDLKIWSFNSLDTIAGGSLQITSILTGVSVRPDCHLTVVNQTLYAMVSNIAAGGTTLYSFDDTLQTWTSEGTVVSNTSTHYLRVHGFEYNSADAKFYTILTGVNSGTTSTYVGPGIYSFELSGLFDGYSHLDYDTTNTTFVVRGPLSNGYLEYNTIDGSISRSSNTEPVAIAESIRVLTYQTPSPKFFNKNHVDAGGDSYYYRGIVLDDGRRLLGGRLENNEDSPGKNDLLLTFVSDTNNEQQHFAWGGSGDDYITTVYQSEIDKTVWVAGYTKSELAQKRDIKVHGYLRNLADGPNDIQWVDLATDSSGNIYTVGNHVENFIVTAKYDYNYDLVWQKKLDAGANVDVAYGIDVDSTDVYICGSTSNVGQGSTDALLVKLTTQGALTTSTVYGTINSEYASSICVVNKSGTKYLALSCVDSTSTSTTILITNTSGVVVEQNAVSSTIINKLRNNVSSPSSGRFIFAGKTSDAIPVAKYGMCEILSSSGRMIQWTDTFGVTGFAYDAKDIRNIDSSSSGYIICGNKGTSAFVLKVAVSESSGVYTRTKSWARTLTSCQLDGMFTTLYTESVKNIYVVGYTSADGFALEDGFMAAYDSSGTLLWQNTLGHTADERLVSVTGDITGDNIIAVGWSESHATAKNAILFRYDITGYGTGAYHLEENASMGYYYEFSSLVDSNDTTSTVTTLVAPANVSGTTTATNSTGIVITDTPFTSSKYDGSYGPNGLWMLFIAKVNLDKVQEHYNSPDHRSREHQHAEYVDSIFTFYQVGTVGDGTADDGNIFGYDLIVRSDGIVTIAAVTSGDVADYNLGISGSYDYLLASFNPTTEKFEFYQNSGSLDEEIYALTELENGNVAFCGRTAGTLGGPNAGGYDIFLGIYNPTNDTFSYYTTGTGFEDKGVNVHDIGSSTIAVTFLSQGSVDGVNFGSEDIGIIKFNYSTNTWGVAYQTGSNTSELVEQNGKPSALLDDGRIAIVGYTAGIFADNEFTYGNADIFLGIVNTSNGVWEKYQVGTGAADFGSSVYAFGDKLLIAGYTNGTFGEESTVGVYVEFDTLRGVGAKAAA